VSGLSALLLDTPLTDGQRVLAHGVRTAGDDVARIIEDIRDFARLEAGGIELDVAELHVGQLVEDAETVMTEPARARGLELLAHCDPALPLPRRGDGRRLRRVLLNLVSNAVRFTEEGEVVIRAQPAAGGQVRFEVVDTAEGTVPEERAWLLAGFVRADSVTTRPHAGTGLGLSVSRRLVEAMGGRTGVETSGRGSTVWFTVPLPVDWFKVPLAVAPDTIAPG
jgi:signal transduction histidine kinase